MWNRVGNISTTKFSLCDLSALRGSSSHHQPRITATAEYIIERANDIEKVGFTRVRLTVSRYIGGSRKRLAKALGRKPDNVVDWQAHHIIPYLEFDKTVAGQQCKRILEKAGIGINDKVNGVWMEKVYHTRALHSNEYIEGIYRRLVEAERRAAGGGAEVLRDRVQAVLGQVASALGKEPYTFP